MADLALAGNGLAAVALACLWVAVILPVVLAWQAMLRQGRQCLCKACMQFRVEHNYKIVVNHMPDVLRNKQSLA